MYVDEAHKDRDHDTAVVKVFRFFHFFNHYYFAVGRGYDYLFGVAAKQADRAAEEVHQYTIYYKADSCNDVEGYFAFQSEIQAGIEYEQQQKTAYQCVCSFTVNTYLLSFLVGPFTFVYILY